MTTLRAMRVLLIEDNSDDVLLVQEALRATKRVTFILEHADRLSQGLARLAQGGVEVVLLDLGLPDSRGLETLRRLREAAPALPIVIMTALHEETLGMEAVRQGAQDYLMKGQVDDRQLPRVLQYAVERAQMQAAAERFARGVGHDFKNLLAIIAGFAELRINALLAGDPGRGDLEEILKACQRGLRMADQLLSLSRQPRMVLQPVHVNRLVQGMDKAIHQLLGDHIEFRMRLADDAGMVHVDPVQLERVLMNLVVNARDAMPQGGMLAIETARTAAPTDGSTTLVVRDTGCGMSEKVRAHLFEPFFTTKKSSGGMGLGLATAYGVITQSGGSITVETAEGQGASFMITLPRVAP